MNTYEMENFERRQTLVDFAHESLHEDDLRQADGQTTQVARERVHVIEVMKLHRVGKVQRHISAKRHNERFEIEMANQGPRQLSVCFRLLKARTERQNELN